MSLSEPFSDGKVLNSIIIKKGSFSVADDETSSEQWFNLFDNLIDKAPADSHSEHPMLLHISHAEIPEGLSVELYLYCANKKPYGYLGFEDGQPPSRVTVSLRDNSSARLLVREAHSVIADADWSIDLSWAVLRD